LCFTSLGPLRHADLGCRRAVIAVPPGCVRGAHRVGTPILGWRAMIAVPPGCVRGAHRVGTPILVPPRDDRRATWVRAGCAPGRHADLGCRRVVIAVPEGEERVGLTGCGRERDQLPDSRRKPFTRNAPALVPPCSWSTGWGRATATGTRSLPPWRPGARSSRSTSPVSGRAHRWPERSALPRSPTLCRASSPPRGWRTWTSSAVPWAPAWSWS